MSSAYGYTIDPPLIQPGPTPQPDRLDVIVPMVTTLADRVEALARRTEAGDLAAGLLAPELLSLVAGAMRDLGASPIAVEALLRFADIGRDHTAPVPTATPQRDVPFARPTIEPQASAPEPMPAPIPAPPEVPADPQMQHAETAAEITYLVMTGLTAEQAAQRVARRFILGNQEEQIPSVGDDPRGYKRLLSWRQQMMAGRYGEAVHAAYTARLAAFKSTGLSPRN